MKKLILPVMLAASFGASAQVAGTLGVHTEAGQAISYENDRGGEDAVTILPMSVNITRFIVDNGIDLEDMTASEAKLALFGYTQNNLEDAEQLASIDRNKLIVTVEGNMISFEKKLVFFKEGAGSYKMVTMADAKIGAAVKLGDEFYIQIQAQAAVPGIGFGNDQSGVFSITDSEFEDFKQEVGCANCDQIDNSEMITTYGANFKVRYKKFGLSVYNNNYFSNATSNLSVAPQNQGVERNDTERMTKNTTVREFGIEVTARIAELGKASYITAIVGYSVTAHMAKTYRERDVYAYDERAQMDLIDHTTRQDYAPESPATFSSVGMLRAGIRFNF